MSDGDPQFAAADLDRVGRATTQFTLGLTFMIPAGIGLLSGSAALVLLMVLISATTMGLSWAMGPTGYDLDGTTLAVRRRFWRPWSADVDGFSRHDDPGRLGIRIGGSSGVFGWYGRFRRSDLGIFRAYLTTREETHVIPLTTSRGVVVVSPADRRGMVRALKRVLR
ncbi:PH domain-containing protein [Euzebya tangerina]|uniref:PH domain-containing protein n=1 Tax=Euzebya tangerina TaxID=591198 RepID=UPI000E30CEC9|nr:PH domain-containing protein [Euzebya tangerina]